MSTQKERIFTLHFNRFIIWLLVVIGCLLDTPFTLSDAINIVAATIWLWIPQLTHLELRILHKWRKK